MKMTYDDFDITFCRGEVKFMKDNVEATMICPVREKCHRYWTQEHSDESQRLGMHYHSFFLLTDPNAIDENGCREFWKKRD